MGNARSHGDYDDQLAAPIDHVVGHHNHWPGLLNLDPDGRVKVRPENISPPNRLTHSIVSSVISTSTKAKSASKPSSSDFSSCVREA